MNIELNIREAKPEDAAQIAEVHIKSWRQAYKGVIHQSYLDNGLDFYERMGAVPIENSEEELTIDGKPYLEMKYEWKELEQ